jgi:glycosyltransferase involved in cell wall biosynthesis
MRKIRVLEIIPSCQRGGVPTVVHNLISHLDKTKFEVNLVAPDDGPLFRDFATLCPVQDIPIRGFYPLSVFRLRSLLKKNRIDVIHGHGKGAGLYGRVAACGSRVRTVYTLHGFNYDHYSRSRAKAYLAVERILSGSTDAIVAVSEGEKNNAQEAGILSTNRVDVIPNGIVFPPIHRYRQAGHVIGTLSRPCFQKGLEHLIQAIHSLKDQYPDIICHIAGGTPKGEGAYEAGLRKITKDLKIDDKVIFLGEITDVSDFLSRTDVYVSASRWEGLPTAILESFAARVPVVATNVVGNNELVRDRQTGILVKACDPRAIADGIEYALANPVETAGFAARAFQYASENYSVAAMVEKHEALYESLVAKQP